jgi:mono/diheme cytochrome c family protein
MTTSKRRQRDGTRAGYLVAAALGTALLLGTPAGRSDDGYERSVRPLFEKKCVECHSSDDRSGGFSVESRAEVLAGGEKYGRRAVIPGQPESSPLLQLLRGRLKPRMPLHGKLSGEEIARVEAWVRGLPVKPAVAVSDEWRWPFERPTKPRPPAVRHSDWVLNPVDAFVLGRLEKAGLEPAPPAPKRALARRLYLDLVGMPPTPEEMSAFLGDDSPTAYEVLVDRLLADPRHGERWGRHWLDLVRYGETNGLEGDGPIGNAWRYRDWVIEAFNDDLPYDRFVVAQLAGADEHSKGRNNYKPDPQGHIPTGFLRVAPWDRSNLVADEVRQNYLNEITDATGSVFLGLTIGCAQCHDHKYDPIPARDFYRFQAFFSAVQVATELEVPYKDKNFAARAEQKVKEYGTRLSDGPEKRALDELSRALLRKLIAQRKARARGRPLATTDLRLEMRRGDRSVFPAGERVKHADLFERATRTEDVEDEQTLEACERSLLLKLQEAYARPGSDPLARFDAVSPRELKEVLLAPYSAGSPFTERELAEYQEASSKLDVYRRRLERWQPVALTVENVPGPPNGPGVGPSYVLTRGDYRQRGEEVKPGFPTALTGRAEPAVLETDRYRQFPTRGWRTTLAKWIASGDNPLTARVMVNRLWHHHFGRGIVATPSNFGKLGDRPTHPELLDWLAHAFVEGGWSIKAVHRLMVLSNTYRQASENPSFSDNPTDPENHLLWKVPRRRQEAEVIRDSVLAVSGRLNREMRGPSVFPPLPDDLADFARYGRTGGVMWEPNESEADDRRRSVYTFQRRSLPVPMMAAFDATAFSESCPRRSTTTTPLQALAMMNGSLIQAEAEALARRVAAEVRTDRRAQIMHAFELALNRPPDPDELATFLAFRGPLDGVCRVLFASDEFIYND